MTTKGGRHVAAEDVALEREFEDDFLHRTGHTRCSLHHLPPRLQDALMKAAVSFATLKVTELRAQEHLVSPSTAPRKGRSIGVCAEHVPGA